MNIAEGSLEECRYYLILAQDLGYGDTTDLANTAGEIGRLLCAYTAAILCTPYGVKEKTVPQPLFCPPQG